MGNKELETKGLYDTLRTLAPKQDPKETLHTIGDLKECKDENLHELNCKNCSYDIIGC